MFGAEEAANDAYQLEEDRQSFGGGGPMARHPEKIGHSLG